MSLKDSLDSARARAERAKQEAERENIQAQNCKKALEVRVDQTIQEAAAVAYQSVCDRIADEIYESGDPRPRASGYMELPDRLRVLIEGARTLRSGAAALDFDLGPHLKVDGESCDVWLVEVQREDIFWGYRKHLALTRYGAALFDAVQRQAQADGVAVCAAVIEESPDGERRFIDMSHSQGSARCTSGDRVSCHLALRYEYEQVKL